MNIIAFTFLCVHKELKDFAETLKNLITRKVKICLLQARNTSSKGKANFPAREADILIDELLK